MTRPLTDFHLHTLHSPDSQAPMETMTSAALARGITALAVTDHVEINAYVADGYDRTLAASFHEAGEMRERFAGRLRVARGVEFGQPTQDRETAEAVLGKYSFDFVIGSLHNLRGEEDFYYMDYTRQDIPALLDRYFEELEELIRWGRFHALGHLTYPFRYFPGGRVPASYDRWREGIDGCLRALSQQGLALEINTSGLRQPIARTLPDLPIVRRFRELGGERITVGSDAHAPVDAGAGVEAGLAVAEQAGFRYVAVYFGGEAEMLPLA